MPPRKLLRIVLALSVLAGLFAATILIMQAVNSPAEGVIRPGKSVSAREGQNAHALITVHGKTATFQYPSTLRQTKADIPGSGGVEKFSFVNPAIPPWDLNIQIRQLPSGQLADDGSYNLRRLHSEQYVEQKSTVNGAPVSIMSDQAAGFGKVAFLTHGGLVAEVALTSTGTASTDQLQATLMTIVQTWRWL